MGSAGKPETNLTWAAAKAATDGETLCFLAATFERVITAAYRQVLVDKLSELEGLLWKIDRALTACPNCQAMNGLAEMIHELHDRLADLAATADRRNNDGKFVDTPR
jgi:hypothetical protein